ncbi:hypothetical protein [Saccharothrix yanglingensis]|uniref:hypothetical protein n=1 Tax=Saccharothrix yanglingensis TaxID=659496 RepID=UPI0027D34F87|nr:hypothetical protein [Saccharothrix yanglingensis]
MTKAQKTASAWAASSPGQLLDHVRGAVEADDAAVRAVWAAVAADQVLAARVRGAFARLKAEHRGDRDEAVWLLRITRAGRQLAAAPAATAPGPRRERPATPVEPEVVLSVAPATTRPHRPVVPALLFREPEPLVAS